MRPDHRLYLNQLRAETADYFQVYIGLQPLATTHPPSLRNPQRVKIDYPQDGWHKKDSKKKKARARADLVEQFRRALRQIGKPEISRTADLPVFPSIQQWI